MKTKLLAFQNKLKYHIDILHGKLLIEHTRYDLLLEKGKVMANLKDPLYHTGEMKSQFDDLRKQLRQAITEIEDPRAQALFETSAEVIGGLKTAFVDYEKKNEPAWRKD